MEMNKKNITKVVAPVCAVALVAGIASQSFATPTDVYATVSIDVNPSIELDVSKDDKVVNIITLNEDAVKIVGEMELEDVDLNVAINALMGSMVSSGYLSQDHNYVMVTVESEDEDKANELKKEVSQSIEKTLTTNNIPGEVLEQVVAPNENEDLDAKISVGKTALINKIISYNNTLSFEELAAMSLSELDELVDEMDLVIEDLLEEEIEALEELLENKPVTVPTANEIETELANVEAKLKAIANATGEERIKLIKELEKEIEALENKIDVLEDASSDDDLTVEALEDKLDELEDIYDDYDDEVDDDDDDQKFTEEEKSTMSKEIEDEIAVLTAKLLEAKNATGANKYALIEELEDEIEELEEKLDELEDGSSDNDATVKALENKLEALKEAHDDYEDGIDNDDNDDDDNDDDYDDFDDNDDDYDDYDDNDDDDDDYEDYDDNDDDYDDYDDNDDDYDDYDDSDDDDNDDDDDDDDSDDDSDDDDSDDDDDDDDDDEDDED